MSIHSKALPENLAPALAAPLRRYGRRLRFWRVLGRLATMVLAAGGIVTLGCAFDRFVDIPGFWRLPLAPLALLAASLLGLWALAAMLRRSDHDAFAHALDQARGDARGHLRTHLDFAAREDGGGRFAPLSREYALALWKDHDAAPYVPVSRDRRLLGAVVLGVLLVVGLSSVESIRAGLLWQRFLDPLGNHPRPSATWFEIEAPDTVDSGDDFLLVTRLRGATVRKPIPVARVELADGTAFVRKLRNGDDGHWRLELTRLKQEFTYILSLHPSRSARHAVQVRPRPTVLSATAAYAYPPYTGLKPKTETLTGRTLTALEGTKVRIELLANIPLQSADGNVEGEPRPFRVDRDEPTRAGRHNLMTKNEQLNIELVARNGLASRRELPFNIRVIADNPPMISAQAGWGEQAVLPTDTIRVSFKVQDDIGLSEVVLKAERENFVQEAELERYGIREAQGVITVPVSSLIGPDTTRVQLRVTALDLKGQAGSSSSLTLNIAVNAYDRQCRMARNSLVGSSNTRNLAESGFPSIDRIGQRLGAMKRLKGKLTILRGMLPDTGKPGKAQASTIVEVRQALAELAPRPAYLLPSIGRRPDDITTSFDILTGAEFTPRLAGLTAESAAAPDLAIAGEILASEFEAAVASEQPKDALEAFAARLGPAQEQLETTAARLAENRQIIELELAGYLAAILLRDLEDNGDASPDHWQDRDFLITRHAHLRELAALLGQPLPLAVPEELKTPLATAAAIEDATRALRESREPLKKLLPVLEKAAEAAAAVPRTPLAFPAIAPAERARLDIRTLNLIMQINDRGIDELRLLLETMANFDAAAGRSPATSESSAHFAFFTTLARFRAACEELRLGLASGQLFWKKPAGDLHWVDLRESRFQLLQLLAGLPENDPLRTPLDQLLNETAACVAWALPAQPPLALGKMLEAWEASSRALAARARDRSLADASRLIQDGQRWRALLASAANDYRQAIVRRVKEIEAAEEDERLYGLSHAVFTPLPRMYARIKAMQLLVVQTLGVNECLAFHGASTTGWDSLEAVEILVVLRRIEKELFTSVGGPVSGARPVNLRADQAETLVGAKVVSAANGAKQGKIKTWAGVDSLVADFEKILQGKVDASERQALLERLVLRHQAAAEIGAMERAARLLDTSSAQLLQDLKGDRDAASAVWAELHYSLAALAREKQIPAPHDLANLRSRVAALGTLPQEIGSLPGLLAEDPSQARWREDLAGILTDFEPLARPPAVFGKDTALLGRAVAAQRARVATRLKLAPPAELNWAVTELEWTRRKASAIETHVGIGGLAVAGTDDLADLKLPRHLYQELKRARESAMPDLYRERAYQYLNRIMEKAR